MNYRTVQIIFLLLVVGCSEVPGSSLYPILDSASTEYCVRQYCYANKYAVHEWLRRLNKASNGIETHQDINILHVLSRTVIMVITARLLE